MNSSCLRLLVIAAGLACGLVLSADDARACGGCFIPPSQNTVVTGHRMAMAVSSTRSVLWDQIQYSGDPDDFAWVLPVKSGAVLELSTDAWFETLEAATSVTVTAPAINCNSGSSGGCMGGSAESLAGRASDDDGTGNPVQVLHEGTVGPYETVTLATSTPGALNDWLDEHGYSVDPDTQPIVDAYVAEGFDFIALRLQPGAGVRQMKPVRVVTQGASATLPLRMVAAGTGASVAIVLFVIGEGRWATDNFPSATIPIDLLSWNFATSESNYGSLRDKVLAANEGRGWITAYARPNGLFADASPPNTFSPTLSLFDDLYVAQGVSNGEITEPCSLPDPTDSSDVVEDPCPPGVPSDDPSCATSVDGIDARTLECGALDDLAAALTGMHPRDVWLTRLEADLPRAALGTDLTLKAADRQDPVSNHLTARVSVAAESFCGSATPVIPSPRDPANARTLMLAAAALALAATLARRHRTRLQTA